jgi:ADP-ribosylglycohydrolase/protein-tyrosine phosphatase
MRNRRSATDQARHAKQSFAGRAYASGENTIMATTKTSETDPIRVDFLPVDAVTLCGRIGMTFAPGKCDLGQYGRWHRDRNANLWRLREVYRTSVLVSPVEPHELQELKIADLYDRAREVGLEVLTLPIADGSVPPSLEAIADLVRQILQHVQGGGNVALHCRGGLGRTGLVAACCLVALGATADAAIRIVRAARPRTVETGTQEEFVRKFERERTLTWTPAHKEGPPLSRFRGCLLGGAIGDSLGYPVEFVHSAREIAKRYGKTPPPTLGYAGKTVISDDTQMTLFTAEGVIRGIQRFNNRGIVSMPKALWSALLRWYATQVGGELPSAAEDPGWLFGDRRLHVRRAPGNTCLSSLAAQVKLQQLPDVTRPQNTSKGCGAVMRSAPIGLAAGSREKAFELARDAAALTHGHPSGYLSAAYFASVSHDVARGIELADAMDLAAGLLTGEQGHEEMVAVLESVRKAAKAGQPDPATIEQVGGGWVGEEALGIGLLCALTAEGSPSGIADALWRAVAHGGDSDSTGSIAGNLLGTMYGIEQLPDDWLAEIELRDVIDRVAMDLYASSILGTDLDFESYPPN